MSRRQRQSPTTTTTKRRRRSLVSARCKPPPMYTIKHIEREGLLATKEATLFALFWNGSHFFCVTWSCAFLELFLAGTSPSQSSIAESGTFQQCQRMGQEVGFNAKYTKAESKTTIRLFVLLFYTRKNLCYNSTHSLSLSLSLSLSFVIVLIRWHPYFPFTLAL